MMFKYNKEIWFGAGYIRAEVLCNDGEWEVCLTYYDEKNDDRITSTQERHGDDLQSTLERAMCQLEGQLTEKDKQMKEKEQWDETVNKFFEEKRESTEDILPERWQW